VDELLKTTPRAGLNLEIVLTKEIRLIQAHGVVNWNHETLINIRVNENLRKDVLSLQKTIQDNFPDVVYPQRGDDQAIEATAQAIEATAIIQATTRQNRDLVLSIVIKGIVDDLVRVLEILRQSPTVRSINLVLVRARTTEVALMIAQPTLSVVDPSPKPGSMANLELQAEKSLI